MKETFAVEYGKRTWKALVQVEKYGYEMPEVFTDFVHFVLNALLSLTDNMKYGDFTDKLADNRLTGVYENRYMEIVAKYKENKTKPRGQRPADYMAEAWSWLQVETAQTQKDVLGHLYESQITLGRQGQFFTPHALFRAMAHMLEDKSDDPTKIQTVHDPACGSGRAFILMAQENPNKKFVGIDISPLMSRIAAINMYLFDLYADILQGNSLSMELNCMWQIRPGGWIWEVKLDEKGRPDGTVEAWLDEYSKNHPPMPEEERQVLIADYERWEKILTLIREMEAQFQQDITTTKKEIRRAVVVAEGYQRINNYSGEDSAFTVALVLPNDEAAEAISQACSHCAHGRIQIADFPAIITNEESAFVFEEAIIASRGSVEPTGEPSAIVLETWQLKEEEQTAETPAETKKSTARKKHRTTNTKEKPVQQTLFNFGETET